MDRAYRPISRSERLIAAGRVVLAASSLFAVWLDPSEPAKYASVAYTLLAAYLAYSALVAALVWHARAPDRWSQVVTHAFDLAFFSLFIYFTAGPSSPFIAYFVFSLLCATLRWRWRGTLWTAVAALSTFLLVGVYFSNVLGDADFELYPFIVRGVYLAVVAVLLAYLGAHEDRASREMALLSGWPQRMPRQLEGLISETLQRATDIVRAARVVIVWVEREEPWAAVATCAEGRPKIVRDPHLGALVAPELVDSDFLALEILGPRPMVLRTTANGLERWQGEPLTPQAGKHVTAQTVLCVRLRGETHAGRLFFLDPAEATSDSLLLGELVAGIVTARLDHYYFMQSLQQAAATEERIRLARDLHDGVLQSLTGVALQLAAIRRSHEQDPRLAADQLEQLELVQRLIALEQRDLRFFIDELRPSLQGSPSEVRSLERRLSELVERIEREWGLHVAVSVAGLGKTVSERMANEVYYIVREAVINAARHGEASRVEVTIGGVDGNEVVISATDNGRGFPFEGVYSTPQLAHHNLGPRNLRDRVTSLKGEMSIASTKSGARIDIRFPQPEVAAWTP